ncbi:MAG: ABC transporter substrate-binding protein, partial [bacterium]
MKMKKLMALMLTLMLAAGALAGCGGSSSGGSAAPAGEAEKEAEAGAEETGSGDAKWMIGEIGPITGGAAIYGLDVAHGAELAVKEINE